MNRKQFIKKSLVGMGAIVAIPTVIQSCSKEEVIAITDDNTSSTDTNTNSNANTSTSSNSDSCTLSPSETSGPFPIKTPAN